jgi:hypothetical protein
MALTKAVVEQAFRAARVALSGAACTVRWAGGECVGIASSTEDSMDTGRVGAVEGSNGAVRVMVSELRKPLPDSQDIIEVRLPGQEAFKRVRVLLPRYDQLQALVRLDWRDEHQ